MTTKLTEIPYRRNSAELFDLISKEPWSIFFDSGYPFIDSGRFDFMSSRPYKTFITHGKKTYIDDGIKVQCSEQDSFELVKLALGKISNNLSDLPFCGGAMGYFAYDLGRRIESIPEIAENDLAIPDMAIGLYDWVAVVDHHKRQSWLVGQDKIDRVENEWTELCELFQSEPQSSEQKFSINSTIQSNTEKNVYTRSFDSIKQYILEGDCYQVNLTQRFSVKVTGDPWPMYLQLRENNPAPFSVYFNTPEACIMSSSP